MCLSKIPSCARDKDGALDPAQNPSLRSDHSGTLSLPAPIRCRRFSSGQTGEPPRGELDAGLQLAASLLTMTLPPTSGAPPPFEAPIVHPTATVEAGATIGAGTRIWHYCHVMAGAVIGSGCSFGQGCHVARGALVGSRVKVQNNVSIYEGVELEDDVFVGPSAVFTNVRNPRAEVCRKHAYRKTRVERGATVGANATVLPGVTIGRYAFVGAGAVVTHDVAPHALVLGSPARAVGWMSRQGYRLAFDDRGAALCPGGDHYELRDGSCTLVATKPAPQRPIAAETSLNAGGPRE